MSWVSRDINLFFILVSCCKIGIDVFFVMLLGIDGLEWIRLRDVNICSRGISEGGG